MTARNHRSKGERAMTSNSSNNEMSETSKSFRATVDHAVRLHLKQRRLKQQVRDSMEVVTGLSVDATDDDIIYAAELLRTHDLPGRAFLRERTDRLREAARRMEPGQVSERGRDDRGPWPIAEHFVYVLLAGPVVVYVGESATPAGRASSHRRRFTNWDRIQLIACRSVEDAKELEADLIYQHQPDGNVMHRMKRKRPGT